MMEQKNVLAQPVVNPLVVDNVFTSVDFSVPLTLEALLKAGAHFGHQKARRNPLMDPYIYTTRNHISIIDLQKTLDGIIEAVAFLKSVREQKKNILFVGTKKQSVDIIRSFGKTAGVPYVVNRWIGGTFTNFDIIRRRVQYMMDEEHAFETGEMAKYTKFERAKKAEEIDRLRRKMDGLRAMAQLPGAIVVASVRDDRAAVIEATRMKIPIVGIVDTNADPRGVDYRIPANDDAVSSLRFIFSHLLYGVFPEAVTKLQEALEVQGN